MRSINVVQGIIEAFSFVIVSICLFIETGVTAP